MGPGELPYLGGFDKRPVACVALFVDPRVMWQLPRSGIAPSPSVSVAVPTADTLETMRRRRRCEASRYPRPTSSALTSVSLALAQDTVRR